MQTLWISFLRVFLTWAQMLLLVLQATWIFSVTVHSFKHFEPSCRLIHKFYSLCFKNWGSKILTW